MKNISQVGWQLVQEPNWIFFKSFYSTRRELIEDAEFCYGRSWKELKESGYKAIKYILTTDI